ncbi:hypothetical protein Taro_001783 [Colocasia esculenta]|uniref:Uncharacterized protein n=1 Tax=Colocasia esculenta TaxID=4460 RepID=A0A843TAX9_COLES|nr:hypothetical protein [Colocasia esculenta]
MKFLNSVRVYMWFSPKPECFCYFSNDRGISANFPTTRTFMQFLHLLGVFFVIFWAAEGPPCNFTPFGDFPAISNPPWAFLHFSPQTGVFLQFSALPGPFVTFSTNRGLLCNFLDSRDISVIFPFAGTFLQFWTVEGLFCNFFTFWWYFCNFPQTGGPREMRGTKGQGPQGAKWERVKKTPPKRGSKDPKGAKG